MVFHRDVESRWPPLRSWPSRDPMFRLVRTGVFPSYSAIGNQLVSNDQTAGNLHNSILLMNADGSRRSVLFGRSRTERARARLVATGGIESRSDRRVLPDDQRTFDRRYRGDRAPMETGRAGPHRWIGQLRSPELVPRWTATRLSCGWQRSKRIANRRHRDARRERTHHWAPVMKTFRRGRRRATASRSRAIVTATTRSTQSGRTGSDVRRLTRAPGNDAHNAWSPDGEWIAFTSARAGFKDESVLHPYNAQPYGDLYVMRSDGTDVRQLTDDQFEDGDAELASSQALN